MHIPIWIAFTSTRAVSEPNSRFFLYFYSTNPEKRLCKVCQMNKTRKQRENNKCKATICAIGVVTPIRHWLRPVLLLLRLLLRALTKSKRRKQEKNPHINNFFLLVSSLWWHRERRAKIFAAAIFTGSCNWPLTSCVACDRHSTWSQFLSVT